MASSSIQSVVKGKAATPEACAPVSGLLQRKCACGTHTIAGGECETCDKQRLQRRAAGQAEPDDVPTLVHQVLGAPGQPLDAATRRFMESRFGHDFSRVRVHTDAKAVESARAVNALAYTVGRNLVFAAGQYRPQSSEGKRLLAHELAHVVQQRYTSQNPCVQHHLRVGDKDDPAEREADAMAEQSLAPPLTQASPSHSAVEASRFAPVTIPTIQRRTGPGTSATTTPTVSCSRDQTRAISNAAREAVLWLNKAVGRMDAFLAKPNDASNQPVGNALNNHFKTRATNIVTYIRGQLNRFRSDLGSLNAFKLECHGTQDATCKHSVAYSPSYDREMLVFCDSFFGKTPDWLAYALVHEIAHAQVGRTKITDRAYTSDRLFKHLTTEEALTNADSYALFVQELESGVVAKGSAPADKFEDCPVGWRSALNKALAIAQRWNREAQVAVGKLTPESAKRKYTEDEIKLIGGATQRDIDSFRNAVNKVARVLESPIKFECEPKGGGRCDDNAAAYWYAIGDLHICPVLIRESPAQQPLDLLGALYGYKADVSGETRLTNYARFAQRRAKPAAPTSQQILGSTAWRADALRIQFDALEPSTPKHQYNESGTDHERMSNDLAAYRAPACGTATLPFRCRVWFYVDSLEPRPEPFTPPRVRVEFRYTAPSGQVTRALNDPRAHYSSTGFPLETKLPNRFEFTFTKNGPFQMRFELEDPDTGITRVYADTIQIEAERPCNAPQQTP